MIRNIEEIKRSIETEYDKIAQLTFERYSEHIHLLNQQYDLLFEFLANFYAYENIKHEDSNQFILCYSLFSEIVRKQQIALQLILRGDYSESAELLRHIMQSFYQIMYLSKFKDSWKEWFEQQNYEQEKLINEDMKNPKTPFNNFKDLLKKLGESQYYKTYQKLCSWSHPSIESMRSNLELSKEDKHKYFFTNRFSEDKAEGLLNLLFVFVNEANWRGFKDTFYILEPVPETLLKYKELHEKAKSVFNLFYVV